MIQILHKYNKVHYYFYDIILFGIRDPSKMN